MNKPVIALIGAGRLGSSLACALFEKGYPVHGVADSDIALAQETGRALRAKVAHSDPAMVCPGAEFIIIAVPDAQVRPVAEALAARQAVKKGQIVCHTSGYLGSSVLMSVKFLGAYTISMHPLMSFSGRMMPAAGFRGVYFGLEGDAVGLEPAREMASVLDAFSVVLRSEDKPLYHAASVMASNYVVALLGTAVALLRQNGVEPGPAQEMLLPLVRNTLDNLEKEGLPNALTGPLERGDCDTVAGHLEALRNTDPLAWRIYQTLGLAALGMAEQKGLPAAASAEMRKLLEPD